MMWNEKYGQCELKEGQRCERGNWKSPCIQHSSCVSGFCECDENYLRNGFGSCFLSYNMPCNKSHSEGQCAIRYGLECVELVAGSGGLSVPESRCRCRGESVDFVWDDYRQKCVSLVGTVCDENEGGGGGPKRDDKFECVQNADCINGMCVCKGEYSMTPDRKCLKKYGERCNNTIEDFCNRYSLLNCGDGGKCGCEFYGQMDYNENIGECRMLVGENCEMLRPGANLPDGRILHKCVEDAKCEMNSKYKHNPGGAIVKGKCVCEAGKIKTADGKCTNLRSYNMSCSFAGDCDKSLFLTCFIDDERGGYCSCPPGEMYWTGTTCLSLPGKRCSEEKTCGRNSTCNDGFCSCNEDFHLDLRHMTCRPRETATTTPTTTTTTTTTSTTVPPLYYQEFVPEYHDGGEGGGLNIHSSVDREEALLLGSEVEGGGIRRRGCTGMDEESLEFHRCSCKLNHSGVKVWSEEKALCLVVVGGACESNEHCIDLAYCEMEDRVCQCLPEARSTLNNTCVLRKRIKSHHNNEVANGGYLNERSRMIPDDADQPSRSISSVSGISVSYSSSSLKRYLMSLSLIPFIFNIIT